MREKIYRLLEGDNKQAVYYHRFMLICIVFSIIPLFFKETNIFFLWADRFTVTIFIIDYLLRWLTTDIGGDGNKVKAFLKYPFSFFAIIDLISILSSLTVLSSGLKLLRLLRLGRAIKVLRLLRYSKSFGRIISVIKKERKALLSVCVLAGGYILLSALIMFQVEQDSFDTFFDAFYWSVVTLTTVGYGDIYPVSDIGRVVSMLSSFMGIAIVALPTGIITAGYMNDLNDKE